MAGNSSDGEVVYLVRADDSMVDSDLDASQKKVEQSVKRAGKKAEQVERETSDTLKKEKKEVAKYHEQQNDEIIKDDKKTGKEREDNEKSVSDKVKDYIKDAADQNPVVSAVSEVTGGLSGAAAGWLAVGTAAVSVGAMAVSSAAEMDSAMNQFLASTGKSKEETERYQTILEGIYKNNYGESFDDIGQAMSNVTKQLGEMSNEGLQNVTESAFALRDTFDYDILESTRAAKAMMDSFGISGEDAMGLIAAGAQNGLDYSGELVDSISEYSVQFAKVGLDADDMFKIFQSGAENGAWNLDKIGDAVKEFSIRAIDGSKSTAEGFAAIGLNADVMAEKFAAGGDSAKEAFEQTISALAGMEDPLAQNAAGVALFGTMWEDLGPEVMEQLAGLQEGAYDTADAMGQIKDVKYDDLGSMFEGLKRNVEMLLIPIGEALMPLLSTLAESVLPYISEVLAPLIELFAELLAPILQLVATALKPLMEVSIELIKIALIPLMEAVKLLVEVFKEAFGGIERDVKSVTENLKNIFTGVIDFIKNVFTGNWKGAWESVKGIFKNIADAMGTMFKSPLNFIIDSINGFLKGLNNIKIPDWIPVVGGKGFNIPTIRRLKTGMDFVPSDYFPAYLDYGERVLTQEENVRYNAMGGIDGLETLLSRMDYQPEQKIVLGKGCIVVHAEIDGKTAASAMAPHMDFELGETNSVGERDQ